jgi:hypothetical protein
MARTALVHQHLDARVLLHERSGRAGMIEMDVREDHLPHVRDRHAPGEERLAETGERRGGPGVDERHARGVVQDGRGDDALMAEELQIDVVETCGECRHVER